MFGGKRDKTVHTVCQKPHLRKGEDPAHNTATPRKQFCPQTVDFVLAGYATLYIEQEHTRAHD
jgi:hypothetical protein